jgi:hypothetical protein
MPGRTWLTDPYSIGDRFVIIRRVIRDLWRL